MDYNLFKLIIDCRELLFIEIASCESNPDCSIQAVVLNCAKFRVPSIDHTAHIGSAELGPGPAQPSLEYLYIGTLA